MTMLSSGPNASEDMAGTGPKPRWRDTFKHDVPSNVQVFMRDGAQVQRRGVASMAEEETGTTVFQAGMTACKQPLPQQQVTGIF